MFYIIGGANIDLYCKSDKELIMKDSNPCQMSFNLGGVARNIAVNLSNLDEDISFITAFGKDSFGDELIDDFKRRDIDLSFSVRSYEYPSSIFMAVLNKEDMVLGMNDLSVLKEINEEVIDNLSNVVSDDDYLFLDTNFDSKLIEYILDNVKGIKVCDAISANKVTKLEGLTGKLDIFKMNLLEAEKLSGRKLFNDNEIVKYIKELIEQGTKEIIISGKDYIYVGKKDDICKYTHDAYIKNPVNTTGAGDALLAYYVYGRKQGLDIDDASKIGIAASVLTVCEELPVVETDINKVVEKANSIKIEKETY